jgi:hypothetical protein
MWPVQHRKFDPAPPALQHARPRRHRATACQPHSALGIRAARLPRPRTPSPGPPRVPRRIDVFPPRIACQLEHRAGTGWTHRVRPMVPAVSLPVRRTTNAEPPSLGKAHASAIKELSPSRLVYSTGGSCLCAPTAALHGRRRRAAFPTSFRGRATIPTPPLALPKLPEPPNLLPRTQPHRSRERSGSPRPRPPGDLAGAITAPAQGRNRA